MFVNIQHIEWNEHKLKIGLSHRIVNGNGHPIHFGILTSEKKSRAFRECNILSNFLFIENASRSPSFPQKAHKAVLLWARNFVREICSRILVFGDNLSRN